MFEEFKAGAAGYVLKDATQEEVIIAVLQGIGGESPLNPTLVNQAAKQLGGEQNIRSAQEEAHPPKDLKSAQSPYNVLLRGLRGEKSRSWDCWPKGTLLGYCFIDVPDLNGSVEYTSWLLGL